MVLKSKTRKTKTWEQLLGYMMQDKGASKELVTRNITKGSILNMAQQFADNEANRIHKRSNNVMLFHDIISFSTKDMKEVSIEMLKDIASRYLEERSEYVMGVAAFHTDTKHPHIHVCMGGVEAGTGQSMRISKDRFREIKVELERYQQERYPELSHSRVDHSKREKKKGKTHPLEYEFKKRTKAPSQKELLKEIIEQSYSLSMSRANFYHRLREQGLETYSRNGTERGLVSEGRKYTFSHLGFDEKHLKEFDIREDAIRGIQVFRDSLDKKEKEIEDDMEIDQDMDAPKDADYKEGKEVEEEGDVIDDTDEIEPDLDLDR
jgi:Relaxase/Mobilisation nuclease domain